MAKQRKAKIPSGTIVRIGVRIRSRKKPQIYIKLPGKRGSYANHDPFSPFRPEDHIRYRVERLRNPDLKLRQYKLSTIQQRYPTMTPLRVRRRLGIKTTPTAKKAAAISPLQLISGRKIVSTSAEYDLQQVNRYNALEQYKQILKPKLTRSNQIAETLAKQPQHLKHMMYHTITVHGIDTETNQPVKIGTIEDYNNRTIEEMAQEYTAEMLETEMNSQTWILIINRLQSRSRNKLNDYYLSHRPCRVTKLTARTTIAAR